MALTINHQTNDISVTSGSITLDGAYVVDGSAKAWGNTSADGTTINDSLNITSLTDLGTGQQRPAFGNTMSTANYAPELTPANNINQIWCQNVESGQFVSKSYTGSAFQDSQHFTTVHGDLA